jgi:rubrerythrin
LVFIQKGKNMRLVDADVLIQKRIKAEKYSPDMYVIGQGYIMDAPIIDPVKHGRWTGSGMGDYTCSWCDEVISGKTNFCPNCGADMR